ncbi:hypothetical protein EV196_107123 [Mariniflexile fucanivorans]|uniref:Uncharacterized protein n=1 Tax=Mariniflexile fucanivorans TaxID=264023 RepID=A0A4R1REV5_9FLAO|nr:hypothetical protein EV196_107123 [Mariniflexile fucanivorans]
MDFSSDITIKTIWFAKLDNQFSKPNITVKKTQ